MFPGEDCRKITYLGRAKVFEADMGKVALLSLEALLPIFFSAEHAETVASAVEAGM